MDLKLKDKVVLVTGGTGGIGTAIVKAFLGEGAKVAFSSTSQAKIDALLPKLGAADGQVAGFVADMTKEEDIKNFVENAKAHFGVSLPYELFEFAKNTGNKDYNIGEINAGAVSYAEIAFGHSRQLTDKLRAGAKLKVLLGIGRADVKMENVQAQLSDANKWIISADAQADVSMKGFTYKQKTKEYKQKAGSYDYVNNVDVSGAGIGGFGLGVDLGATYKLNDDWSFSAALLDLGFIS